MAIKTLSQAEQALLPYVSLVGQLSGKDMTLQRMWPLMELLGNPQDQLKIVHIAGTSGKTSTAYYLSALLTSSGLKTGLTVSPHVDYLNERVQINGQPLAESPFCQYLHEFLQIIERAEYKPTYFELLYAFALWIFVKENVDYAVVETGMGGLHDATNVARRPNKICVITDIGFDHMHILGDTLEAITAQKVGIVHERNQVLMYRQPPAVMDVVKDWIKNEHATLKIVPEPPTVLFSERNWQLAKAVFDFVGQREGLKPLSISQLKQTQQITIPGRLEVIKLKDKTIVMDGAHNYQKIQAMIQSFQKLYPGVKPVVLLALKQIKDYQDLIPLLQPFASQVITTVFNTTQDLPAKATDPRALARALQTAGIPAQAIPDQHQAWQAFLKNTEKIGLVTGSFYLLSQLRHNEKLV